jgi:hypothetical protein
MKAKEIVDVINSKEALYCSPHYIYDEIDELDEKDFQCIETVDYDEHRWYIIATKVFKTRCNEFFGVRGVFSKKSETMCIEDCNVECFAFEMEEVPTVTYKEKT